MREDLLNMRKLIIRVLFMACMLFILSAGTVLASPGDTIWANVTVGTDEAVPCRFEILKEPDGENNGEVQLGVFAGSIDTSYDYAGGKLIIPSVVRYNDNDYDVVSIRGSAFRGFTNLTGDLVIPSSITSIGSYAFYQCKIESLTIGGNVESIEDYAFYACSELTGELFIPSSVTSIGNGAFGICEKLSSLRFAEGIELSSLKESVFSSCYGLTGDLIIPSSVTSIGNNAFYRCENLSSLTFEEGSKLTAIGNSSFFYCIGIRGNLTIPSTVTSIGENAFKSCGFNGTLTIGENVESIGGSAFSYCSGLRGNLFIPESVTSIGGYAFESCYEFSSLRFAEGCKLTSIANGAFRYCSGLTGNLTIPSTVTSIGNSAFDTCLSLTGLTIGENVMSIGDSAFSHCEELTGILTIPSSVTSIGKYAFLYCENLDSLRFEEDSRLETIGEYAFWNCFKFTGDLFIPSSVSTIAANAFLGCSRLSNVILLSAVAPAVSSNSFTGSYPIYYPCEGTGYDTGVWETAYNSRLRSDKESTPNATFTATGSDTGILSGVASGMEYSMDDGDSWFDIAGNSIELTGLSPCIISVIKRGGKAFIRDSEIQTITVTKAPIPDSVDKADCTTFSNYDGKLIGVTSEMEYKLSTDSDWEDGNDSDITGLSNGIYYVRIKVSGTVLASDKLIIVINEYIPESDDYIPAPVSRVESGDSITGQNFEQLISEGKTFTVDGDNGAKLVFDTDALKGISGQTSGNVKVEMKDVSASYQESFPGKLVFSLTVSSGNEIIKNFGGEVTVTLPYELKEGENPQNVTVWHLASDGTMTEIPCTYNPVTKRVTFIVTHFSFYVVGVSDTEPWVNPFSDVVESDWFYDAVEFVNRNGLFSGTNTVTFSPNSHMTRAMIWTVLGRLDGQSLSGSSVYDDARSWAMSAGITDGSNPSGSVTREQMATILWRYAGSPKAGGDLSRFSDAGSVASYAIDAMVWMAENDIITGENGALMPQNNATRAQVAAILQRYIK